MFDQIIVECARIRLLRRSGPDRGWPWSYPRETTSAVPRVPTRASEPPRDLHRHEVHRNARTQNHRRGRGRERPNHTSGRCTSFPRPRRRRSNYAGLSNAHSVKLPRRPPLLCFPLPEHSRASLETRSTASGWNNKSTRECDRNSCFVRCMHRMGSSGKRSSMRHLSCVWSHIRLREGKPDTGQNTSHADLIR